MDIHAAKNLIEGLFREVWVPSDALLMDKYYDKAVTGYVGSNVLTYDGIFQRIYYNKKT